MIKDIAVIVIFLLFTVRLFGDAQRALTEQQVKELIELNKIVLEKVKDIDKLNNKTVYIKAKVLQQADKTYTLNIENISADGIKQEINQEDKNESIFYIKGKITKNTDDNKYRLDIDSVLPPESKSDAAKNIGGKQNKSDK